MELTFLLFCSSSKALTQNIKIMNVNLNEETFSEMTDEIRDFSLISLTDDLNNIAVKQFIFSFKQI